MVSIIIDTVTYCDIVAEILMECKTHLSMQLVFVSESKSGII